MDRQTIPPQHTMVGPQRLAGVVHQLLDSGIGRVCVVGSTAYPVGSPFGMPSLTPWPFLLVPLSGPMRVMAPSVAGAGWYAVELQERDAVVYGPGAWPSIERSQTRAHFRATFADDGVLLGVRDWRESVAGRTAMPGSLELCLLEGVTPARVRMLLDMVFEPGGEGDFDRAVPALQLVFHELLRMLQDVSRPRGAAVPSGWVSLREYVRQHVHESPSREQAALALGITARHVSRLCRAAGSGSYLQYLDRLRIERAKALLLQRRVSVKLVAEACGFSSVNYFVRVFRKRAGVTPGAWRRSAQGSSRVAIA